MRGRVEALKLRKYLEKNSQVRLPLPFLQTTVDDLNLKTSLTSRTLSEAIAMSLGSCPLSLLFNICSFGLAVCSLLPDCKIRRLNWTWKWERNSKGKETTTNKQPNCEKRTNKKKPTYEVQTYALWREEVCSRTCSFPEPFESLSQVGHGTLE